MPSANTWWWIGIGSGLAAVGTFGTGLVINQRRRHAMALPPRRPPDRAPLAEPPRKPKKPEPEPSRTTPWVPTLRTENVDGSGKITAYADGEMIVPGELPNDPTTLAPTAHRFRLFTLPDRPGEFEIQVCVALDYTLDTFTWERILKWEDDKRRRLFPDPHVRAYERATIRGTFNNQGDIGDVEVTPTGYLFCNGLYAFPTAGAFMYLKRAGAASIPFSWGGFLTCISGACPPPGPDGLGGASTKYRPRFTAYAASGKLYVRVWIAPLPRLAHAGENIASVRAVDTPYNYAYQATLRYER